MIDMPEGMIYRVDCWSGLGSSTVSTFCKTDEEVWAAIGKNSLFGGYQVYDKYGATPTRFIPY